MSAKSDRNTVLSDSDYLPTMRSARWDERVEPPSGIRPVAALSGRRLASVIYDLIKERLLEGGFIAGQRLQVEALKGEFGVSKQPVMDAMRRLAADGLVEIIPQVGCRVPRYEPGEVSDFYTMFGGMEGAIAGVAATRWTGSELAELRALNERISELAHDVDPTARSHGYRVMNREFHARIHRMSCSRVIAEMSQRMWDLSDLLINTAGAPQPLASAIPQRTHDHAEICGALTARDAAAARAAMERHIVATIGIIRTEIGQSVAGG